MGNKLGSQQSGVEDPGSITQPLIVDLEDPIVTPLLADVEDNPLVTNESNDQLLAAELLAIELLAVAKNPTVTNDQLLAVVDELAGTVENGRHEENEDVQRNIFVRTWKILMLLLTKLLFTPAQPVQLEDGTPVLPLQDQPRRIFAEGIVQIALGLRLNINEPSDLTPIANLVKEKAELVKYVESIYKSGRDFRHNIILTLVGTILVGILNAIVDGLLADHISLAMRILVLAIFSVTFMVYLGGATYEMHSIYEPSLTDAVSSHSLIIRSMNVNRNALAVKESVPKKEGLSNEDERQLEYMLEEYCKKIIEPLPISQKRKHLSPWWDVWLSL